MRLAEVTRKHPAASWGMLTMILMFWPAFSFAQNSDNTTFPLQTAGIGGIVVAANAGTTVSTPFAGALAGAKVTLHCVSTDWPTFAPVADETVETTDTGTFFFPPPIPGAYQLKVSKADFLDAIEAIAYHYEAGAQPPAIFKFIFLHPAGQATLTPTESPEVTLTPQPTSQAAGIGGIVLAGTSSAIVLPPVAGANVTLHCVTSDWPSAVPVADETMETSELGTFYFLPSVPGEYRLIVSKPEFLEASEAVAYHYEAGAQPPAIFKRIVLRPSGQVTLTPVVTGTLEPTATLPEGKGVLFGVVTEVSDPNTDPPTRPIAGARVQVRYPVEVATYPPSPPIAEASTDENGAYRIENLPLDLNIQLIAIASKEGYIPLPKFIQGLSPEGLEMNFELLPVGAPTLTPGPTLTPVPTEPPPTGDGVLFGVVSKRVESGGGVTTEPLAAARVRVGQFTSTMVYPVQTPIADVLTDELGRYRIENLPTNLRHLVALASKDGYGMQYKRVDGLTSQGLELNFELQLFNWPTLTPRPTLTGGPTRTPEISPTATGEQPSPTATAVPALIRGRVIEQTSNSAGAIRPIAQALVEIRPEAEIEIYPPPPPLATAYTNAQGYYRIEKLTSDTTISLIAIASKEGYEPRSKPVGEIPAAGKEINFALKAIVNPTVTPTTTEPPQTGVLSGRVLQPPPIQTAGSTAAMPPLELKPLPGATVEVWIPYILGSAPSTVTPLGSATTDENGEFRIEGLPVGAQLLAIASKENYNRIEQMFVIPNSGSLEKTFVLTPLVSPTATPTSTEPPADSGICGLVVEQSLLDVILPIPGALVEVYPGAYVAADASGSVVATPTTEPIARVRTDEKGHFCAVPLAPGFYAVSVRADGFFPGFRAVQVPEGNPIEIVVPLEKKTDPTITPTPSEDTGAIFGQVTTLAGDDPSSPSAVPVPGAEVLVIRNILPPTVVADTGRTDTSIGLPAPIAKAVTNREGKYEIANIPAGEYLVIVAKPGFKYAEAQVEVAAGASVEASFVLEPQSGPTVTPTEPPPADAGALYGMVYNELAMSPMPMPIAGAEVVVYPRAALEKGVAGTTVPILGRAKTNEKGLYRIEDIAVGPVVVAAMKQGWQRKEVRAFVYPSTDTLVNIGLAPSEVTTPTLTVTPTLTPTEAARVFGHVAAVDASGKLSPIPGAKVCLVQGLRTNTVQPEPVQCAETNEQGRYSMEVPAGEYAAIAEAAGYQRSIKAIQLKPGVNPILDFALTPEVDPTATPEPGLGGVKGIVTNFVPTGQGRPTLLIAGAVVSLYSANSSGVRINEAVARAKTNENGEYAIDGVAAGAYLAVAEKEGYERDVKTVKVIAGEVAEASFALKERSEETTTPTPTPEPKRGAIVGLVAAASDATTQPIAGALVVAVRVQREDAATAPIQAVGHAVTDIEGRFNIEGLAAGEYYVIATARGFEQGKLPVTVEAGQSIRAILILTPEAVIDPETPGSIQGRVMHPSLAALQNTGRPLSEKLALEPIEGTTVTSYLIQVNQTDPASMTPSGRAITDAEGRFEIVNLKAGAHIVIAQASGYNSAIRMARVAAGEATEMLFVLISAGSTPGQEEPPTNVVDQPDVTGDESAHWEAGASSAYTNPVNVLTSGGLVLRSKGNNCFGYWQTVRGWIPRIDNSLYAVTFTAASNQENPADAPSMRLRVNSDSNQQSDMVVINTLGDAGLAPTQEGTSYRMFFEPLDSGEVRPASVDRLNVAFDLLNFDKRDNPEAEVALKSLTVDAIPLSKIGEGTVLKTWDFADGEQGWHSGGALGTYIVAGASLTGNGLELRAKDQKGVFGWWSSPNGGFLAPDAGSLLRVTFNVVGNQTDSSLVSQLRVRLHAEDGQIAVVKAIESKTDGANSPTIAGASYRLYFQVPPALAGKGLIASFDLLGFDAKDAEDNALTLQGVAIEQIPAPSLE